MSQVSIVKCEEYNQEEVNIAIEKLIDNLGGLEKFVKKGSKVLLKINLLFGKHPDKMVTTHPTVVGAVAKILKKHNCQVFIGDSPALGSCIKACKKALITEVADKLDCTIVDFNKTVRLDEEKQKIFKDIEIASELRNYDAIINLPKVKTHGQMGLTLGVKNMFGCVVGLQKLHWHLKAGVNKHFFAKMLVEIYNSVNPVLTITDGIIGMEGNGPQHGSPRKLGVITASKDAVASDIVISHLINYNPEKLFTNIAARELNIGTTRMEDITFTGDPITSFNIVNFRKIPFSSLEFRVPSFMAGFLKNHFSTKPYVNKVKCTGCKICMDICPPKVITFKNNKPYIDQRQCIRCFCCQEICPEGAISVVRNWLGGIFC